MEIQILNHSLASRHRSYPQDLRCSRISKAPWGAELAHLNPEQPGLRMISLTERVMSEIEQALQDEKNDPPGLRKAIRKFGVLKTFLFILALAVQLPVEWLKDKRRRKS